MARYLIHVFIGFNQFVTTILGGWPDETLSSYSYRLDQRGKLWGRFWRPVIDWLFSWQGYPKGHCHAAWEEERKRLQLPHSLR